MNDGERESLRMLERELEERRAEVWRLSRELRETRKALAPEPVPQPAEPTRCETCAAYYAFACKEDRRGTCRLKPPIWCRENEAYGSWVWPVVGADSWCLEYARRAK